jgi:hypothetical protein
MAPGKSHSSRKATTNLSSGIDRSSPRGPPSRAWSRPCPLNDSTISFTPAGACRRSVQFRPAPPEAQRCSHFRRTNHGPFPRGSPNGSLDGRLGREFPPPSRTFSVPPATEVRPCLLPALILARDAAGGGHPHRDPRYHDREGKAPSVDRCPAVGRGYSICRPERGPAGAPRQRGLLST